MLLRLQKYRLNIVYKPGKEIPLADTLSRKFLPNTSKADPEIEMQVHTVVSNAPVSDAKMESLKEATAADAQLRNLAGIIREGWPETRAQCPKSIVEYWNHRDELAEYQGILFKGDRIIVPAMLRKEMLTQIHIGHMGIEKCKRRARDVLFWPGMNADIENQVSQCSICQERQKPPQKEPMIPHEVPTRPWQTVASDLFVFDQVDYLLITDYYSRFFEIQKLTSTKSSAIIHKTKSVFARHGVPEKVVSDNGPQYSSQEYMNFANKWGFIHLTSSPRYPQSNGLAEKFVQTAKSLLEKAKADNKDPYLSILEYRNTPIDGAGSPAQLLMSRRLRSVLPNTTTQLQPKVQDPMHVANKLQHKQERQKSFYDRNAKAREPFKEGETVRVQRMNGTWQRATIKSKANSPRSYNIHTESGQDLRRTSRHIHHTKENQPIMEYGDTVPQEHNLVMPQLVQPTMEPNPPVPMDNAPQVAQPYTTRSGRVVKPNPRYQ
jgi:hypothetical protein